MKHVSILNEALSPEIMEQVEGSNFWIAVYSETKEDPLLSLSGTALLSNGDEKFHFENNNFVLDRMAGRRPAIVDGRWSGREITLTWVGKPDQIFVSYLTSIKKERSCVNWTKEGF